MRGLRNRMGRRTDLGVWRQRSAGESPLSQALLPLINGLTRRMLLRRGVVAEDHRLCGMTIHVYRAPSQAPPDTALPVLLVHGIADSALTWSLMILPLSRIGPVYAVDLPGFGLSGSLPGRRSTTLAEQRAVLEELITQVIGQPPLVVGNSLGGWLAARLALVAPRLTRGIVLIDPGGALLKGRESWQAFVDVVAVPDLRTVRLIYRQMFGRAVLLGLLYLAQRGFQAMFARDAVREFVATASEEDFLSSADLRSLETPVGLVWGLRDRFLPSGSLEFFRDNLPDAEVLLLPRAGHLPQREYPLQVVRFIRAFVRRLMQPTPAGTDPAPDRAAG